MQQIEFHSFRQVPRFKLVNQVRFRILSVTDIVREQSFYTDVVDEVSNLFEMVGNRLVAVMFYVSQVFFEVSVKGASPRFADVEFSAFGAMNNVHDIVRLAVELFADVHLGFRP